MSEFVNLLDDANRGDPGAADDLFRLVYDDLRRLAGRYLDGEKPGLTLQPTALVHEAYLRLLGGRETVPTAGRPVWEGRGHFVATAARAMRRILVEAARKRNREKRGGGRRREDLDPDQIAGPEQADDLLALNDALTELAAAEPVVAELVNLRYFGGLTVPEAAGVLGIAPRTADGYWAYARAWLLARLTPPPG